MSKHTPGPWAVLQDKKFPSLVFINALDGPVIDEGFGQSNQVEMANAQLIASAPEMLEALKTMQAWLWGRDIKTESETLICAALGEIIKKAEGRK